MNRLYVVVCVILIAMLVGCTTNSNKSVTINETNITKIQIVKAMGDPELGAKSKVFTEEEQVSMLVSAINTSTIKEKVKSGDIGVGDDIDFYYYLSDGTIKEFQFRSHDTIWIENELYYISFNEQSIFDIYDISSNEEIKVDENLNEMK